jgi:hypothetical protein
MGVVWRAYDSVLRRYVALKLLSTQIAKTARAGGARPPPPPPARCSIPTS